METLMLEELLRTIRKTAPPKRWRNKYRVKNAVIIWDDRPWWRDGVHWGDHTFPSKEIAEQRGREWVYKAWDASVRAWENVFWEGAYPVDDE
jgi:hypothetical protein